jgi:hypothetical protein
MSLRGAIALLGDEWARLNRMIQALEREAETHHKRHVASIVPGNPPGSRPSPPQPNPFTHPHSSPANRRGL